jgi:hypothetical protein
MNCYNHQLAPLWAHAMENGMSEAHPEWVNNDDEPPTMTEIAEQSAMISEDSDTHDSMPSLVNASDDDTDTDSSSLPELISDSDNESEYSLIQTPPHYTSSEMPMSPDHNFPMTTNYPFDNSVVIDLTNEFNTVG